MLQKTLGEDTWAFGTGGIRRIILRKGGKASDLSIAIVLKLFIKQKLWNQVNLRHIVCFHRT